MLFFAPGHGCRTETLGSVTASSRGTLITASSSANVKGTAVSLGTPAFAYSHIVVGITGANTVAGYLVDISVGDPASAGYVICPDLRVPAGFGTVASFGSVSYPLPLRVQAGTALYARVASSTGTATCKVSVAGFSAGLGGAPGFARMLSLYTPSSSKGAAWTSPGSANADSAWTQLSSGVTSRLGAVVACVGSASTSGVGFLLRFGAGAAGSQRTVVGPFSMTTGAVVGPYLFGPYGCDIDASTAVWIAGQASGTSLALDVALWGFAA